MQTCPSCSAPLSLGATDCAVCGHLLSAGSEVRAPSSARLVAAGIAAALWVGFTSVALLWVYPVLLVAALLGGLAVARHASRASPKALLLLALPLSVSALWLWHVAKVNHDFGSAILFVGAAQTALLLVPALVWPRRRS